MTRLSWTSQGRPKKRSALASNLTLLPASPVRTPRCISQGLGSANVGRRSGKSARRWMTVGVPFYSRRIVASNIAGRRHFNIRRQPVWTR